jgi:DNA-binding response OmpR family regulator
MKNKVLIIDDDTLIVESTRMALDKYGFETSGAPDGKTGLEAALLFRPDLILLDIIMPGIDGWKVLKTLKNLESTHAIPVIIFTADEYPDQAVHALNKGAADFIAKPFYMEEMISVLRRHFEARGEERLYRCG